MSLQSFRAKGPVLGLRRPHPGRLLAAAGLAAGCVAALPAPLAHAGGTHVPCSVPALVAAIKKANGSPGADTLRLAHQCTYTLTAPDGSDDANGLPVITTEITIHGSRSTIKRSSRATAPAFRILAVSGDGNLTLEKVTIAGGRTADAADCPTAPDLLCGGGIFNAGTLALRDSRVTGNSAAGSVGDAVLGGGLHNEGTATLTDTRIDGNTAANTGAGQSIGAGVSNFGTLTVNRGSITRNTATATGLQAVGGGLNNFGDASVTRAVISSNTATNTNGGFARGGGIGNAGSLTLTVGGGGITNRAVLELHATHVRENSAGASNGTVEGGGLRNALGGTATLTGTPVSGNTADAPGGTALGAGVFNGADSTTSLERSPVKENTARASGGSADGGGVFNEAALGDVTLTGSRVADNRPNNCAPPGSVAGCTG